MLGPDHDARNIIRGCGVTKLVYIGGYGRSGSTLLEYLLTASPDLAGCGEVVSCVRRGFKARAAFKNNTCSCGKKAKSCPVWRGVFTPGDSSAEWTHERLVRALLKHLDGQYAAIVDSSKTAWGSASSPFRLRRAVGPDFYLIHLVRDPRAVFWSVLKQKRKRAGRLGQASMPDGLLGIWTMMGWLAANLSCELFGHLHPDAYMRIRYEDLSRSPDEVVRAICARISPDIRWSSDKIGRGSNRHQLYGNKMRRAQLSVAEVKEDLKWKTEMPKAYLRAVMPASFPLRRRYGYR
jgi:hypothetical protein